MNATQVTKPTKEQVRTLMERHRADRTPPLSPEQFRRELGWGLIKNNITR